MHNDSQPIDAQARLATAWERLLGERRTFHVGPMQPPAVRPDGSRCVILPIVLKRLGTRAAVSLVVSEAQARDIAAVMLGVPHDTLTDADVVDACGEACNVLSGCVVQELDGGTPLELGLPVHLIASEYTELTSNSTLRLSFEAGPVARDVLMYLFDPLSPLATREN